MALSNAFSREYLDRLLFRPLVPVTPQGFAVESAGQVVGQALRCPTRAPKTLRELGNGTGEWEKEGGRDGPPQIDRAAPPAVGGLPRLVGLYFDCQRAKNLT